MSAPLVVFCSITTRVSCVKDTEVPDGIGCGKCGFQVAEKYIFGLAIALIRQQFHRKTGKPENRKTGKPEN
ncbi:hypothetical protein, partial [Halocynthiibacter sp.]|uniref:hypothetical protein n=1 Tax=Halocynthiibacter sp. TaxID=1979210 RepID=UPI003C57615F